MNFSMDGVAKKLFQEANSSEILFQHDNNIKQSGISNKNMYTNKQSKMESQRKVAYIKNRKKSNRHQHNTDDGGQAIGEEMRHVQMSGKHIGEESKQQ